MSEPTMRPMFFDPRGLELSQLEAYGNDLAEMQRDVNWFIGDLARYAEARWPSTWQQAFPEWMSPGLIKRCQAVSKAYPKEADRNQLATWTQHMQVANRPDRIELVAEMVDKGQTTDESRKAPKGDGSGMRWLLAIDVNYYLHRFWHSGAGVEAASSVDSWIKRTAERLTEKGLTDLVCCFDAAENRRKLLTESWEDKYKDRPPKDRELVNQLVTVRDLLERHGFLCVSVDGMEADDCMASYASQFPGQVTLLTQDKDCRQCLSAKCNMLLDVEWFTDKTSGDMKPDYKWISATQHTNETNVAPGYWIEYQSLAGDNVDGIRGAEGIGKKGATDLVNRYLSAESAIAAAKANDDSIKPAARKALIEFEPKLKVTRELVTLRTDLQIPMNTRLS